MEGLLSQDVRAFGLRTARYRGLARMRLQHLLTAAAVNLARLANRPRAVTKPTTLAALLGLSQPTAALT